MRSIRSVEVLSGFTVRLTFDDASVRVVDLRPLLHGPIFEKILSDEEEFRRVEVDAKAGTIVWPNGADMDPDVLHGDEVPAWMESAS